jgi:hypothetical protein
MFAALFALALAADTTSYVVLNHGRPAGEMLVIAAGDTTVVRYHHYDRQRGTRSEARYRIRGGQVVGGETWQLPLYGTIPSPLPAPNDRFEVVRDSVFWGVDTTRRSVARTPASFYRMRSGTLFDQAMLVRHLLTQPNRTATLLPAGTARAEIIRDTTLRIGNMRQRARLAMVYNGNFPVPTGLWIDERGEPLSGQVGWFITVRRGIEPLLPAFRAIELAFRDAQGAEVARRLAPPSAPSIAIINGDVFDSERGVIVPRTTVLVRGDRIVAVGSDVAVPADARVIDAAGKTVIPGLYDMHGHIQHTTQSTRGISDLAQGITTMRDLAADIDVAVSHRDRAARGDILGPRIHLGGFIEGPGHWAGPSEVLVRTEAEARSWVARYDSLGYKQIKLYNLVHPDLVPAIAEETHKRGMRLSGHVPRGITTQTAVRLGFDEINHAAFLFSTFYQDSLYWPVMRAYSGVSQIVAPHVDVDGQEVTAMIGLFKEKGTVIDGTWQLWLSSRGAAASSSLGIPNAASQTLAEKSDANYMRMLKRLFDAGIPLVPGTDGADLRSELELYERAGIPAAQVLRIATWVPATVIGEAKDYGSIAVGKVADIAIIDGKPAERIRDVRNVRQVLRAGRLYEASALEAAINRR